MKPLFDLSLRYKMPLWGAFLIGATTVAISAVLMTSTYKEVREDISLNAAVVSSAATTSLIPALKNDDLWHAYLFLSHLAGTAQPYQSESRQSMNLVVMDEQQRIVVAADPKRFPMLGALSDVSAEFGLVARRVTAGASAELREFELPDGDHFHFARHLDDEHTTLIISYPKTVLNERFAEIARRSLIAGLLVLVLLLPFSWYWGRRMSMPLVEVASQIRALSGPAAPTDPTAPAAHQMRQDEVEQLYDSYLWMLRELETKKSLQEQVVRSERLAAVGQLAAGVAHEINNPLSGMLTAIDTLKEFGQGDFRTMKTVGLLERGLTQIRDIVGALLVQASVKGRPLNRDDIEDIRLLVKLQADKTQVELTATQEMPASVPITATAVRQIMTNLLLNAVQATPPHGHVALRVIATPRELEIIVTDDGEPIPPERLAGIFEPFSSTHHAGHGLGLWVTYQMVIQLHGRIHADSDAAQTRFIVTLPLEMSA